MRGVLFGFGNMGITHLNRYENTDIERIDVIEIDQARREKAQEKGLTVYESFSDIPNKEKVDFVDICTPTHVHYENIEEVADLDIPMLIEKPIVRTKEEISNLREYSSLPIFVAEVEQYNPAFYPFLEYNGNPEKIEMNRNVNLDFFLGTGKTWNLDEEKSGGIVHELMIHDLNLLVCKYGLPDNIIEVEERNRKYEISDEVKIRLDYGNFEAELFGAWTSENETPIIASTKISDSNEMIDVHCENYHMIDDLPPGKDPFQIEIEEFLDFVKTGDLPYSLEDYLKAAELSLDIKEIINEK